MTETLERVVRIESTLENQNDDLLEIKQVQKETLMHVNQLLTNKAVHDSEMRIFKRMAAAIAIIVSGAVNVAILFAEAFWKSKV